jgi:hypothetical protein
MRLPRDNQDENASILARRFFRGALLIADERVWQRFFRFGAIALFLAAN